MYQGVISVNKDLPKMYQNKLNKKFTNVQNIYSTIYEQRVLPPKKYEYKTIETKINNIFKSPNYIYKIDVIIETDNATLNKRIIGKNKTNLITIDNEYIPINNIKDIKINNN